MRAKLSIFSLIILCGLLTSFTSSKIPKGEHVLWHDGGEDYFALFENGNLYSVHNNKYHKIHKVYETEIVEEIFQTLKKHDFTEMPPPYNKDKVIAADEEHFRHIQYRKDGRVYEVYWTSRNDDNKQEFLLDIFKKLMGFV